jgi:hypothetical protein
LASFANFYATINTAGKTAIGSGVASSVRVSAGRYEVKFTRDIIGCAALVNVNGIVAGYGVTRTKPGADDTVQVATFNKSGVVTDLNSTLFVMCNN